jgi:hypothetical protein
VGLDKYGTILLFVCFIFIWHLDGSRKYPNGVFNFKCENTRKHKCSLKKLQTFIPICQKKSFPCKTLCVTIDCTILHNYDCV